MNKQLSIIIPAYNNFKLSMKCLAHIFHSTYPQEKIQVIFVDNASTDGTPSLIKYVQNEGKPVTYLRQKENLNFCKGINVGLKEAKTPYIMLLNNDVFLDKDAIEIMMAGFKKQKNVGIVGGMEYLMGGMRSKDKPFIYFHPQTLLDPVLKDYKDLGFVEEPNYVAVDIVGSACCIIKKDVIDRIGYFDELFSPAMFEQEDLFLRAYLDGFTILLATKANFEHCVGATTAFDTSYYQKIIKENKQKFLNKWSYLIDNER